MSPEGSAELLTQLRWLSGDIIWNDWSTQLDSKLAWSKSGHKACSTDGLKILYYKNCNDIKGINQSHMKSSVKDLIGWCSVMDTFLLYKFSFWRHRQSEFFKYDLIHFIWHQRSYKNMYFDQIIFKPKCFKHKVTLYVLRVCAACELLVTLALGFFKWTAQRQIRTGHKPKL